LDAARRVDRDGTSVTAVSISQVGWRMADHHFVH